MRLLVALYCFVFSLQLSFGQEIKRSIMPFDISKGTIAKWYDGKKRLKLIEDSIRKGLKEQNFTQEEDSLIEVYINRTSFWDISSLGCSWYCSGGPDDIMASNDTDTSSEAPLAHDFDLKTIWRANTPKRGVGEAVMFNFPANSPAFDEIIIYNGYMVDSTLWGDLCRVKQFRLYLDDEDFGILNLEDSIAVHTFKLPKPVVPSEEGIFVTLEVVSVYPGKKYKTLAISEINFNGPTNGVAFCRNKEKMNRYKNSGE